MPDLVMVKEATTRKTVLVPMSDLIAQQEPVTHDLVASAAMQAAMIPEYNLQRLQHFSRVKIERLEWSITGFGYATNTWNWMPFAAETTNPNNFVWLKNSALWLGRYVCREDGMYSITGWWKAVISAPLVNVAQLYEAELGYYIERKHQRVFAQGNKFDTVAPAGVQHLGGTPYYLVDIKDAPPAVLRRPYLNGWHVSGADEMPLLEGDVVYTMFRMMGNAGDIEFFDYFAARTSICRIGDLYTGEECC